MNDRERRGHLRYREPDGGVVRLLVPDGESDRPLTALPVNESHTGLACVYVGAPIEPGVQVVWQETKDIRTQCRVMRCERLHPDVHLLAMQIEA